MESFETTIEPYSRMLDLYQSYYRGSLAAYCAQEGIQYRETSPAFTGLLRFLGRARLTERLDRLAPPRLRVPVLDFVARILGAGEMIDHVVGKYVYRNSEAELNLCIDAEDSGDIKRPELLEWSDLYFKTNYWPDRVYGPKVVPLANVNPLVLTRAETLRNYRNCQVESDLFGFFRVWGRIEHNLALFEALAQLKCKKRLLAYIISSDYGPEVARLEKAGIEWTTRPLPLEELWKRAAQSRLNIVRHGMDDCVPWRMTDIMAMGHCPVLDYGAKTQWNTPLLENVHYLSLDLPPEHTYSPRELADRVAGRVESWLSEAGLIERISQNAARYFDENLTPPRLGRYLVEQSRKFIQSGSTRHNG